MARLLQVCFVVAILVSCMQTISAAPWIDSNSIKDRKPWRYELSDWNRERKPDVDGGLTFVNGNLYFTPAIKVSKPPTVIESNPQSNKPAGGVNSDGSILIAARSNPGTNAHYGFDLKDGVIYH